MQRTVFISFLLLVFAVSAFASGGGCPAGSNYLSTISPAGALVSLATSTASGGPALTSCYYISAAGSDSLYDGTTEAVSGSHGPFLHAPGMPNCTSNCAAVTPSAGEGFIFRGGDTWNFGNSAAAPYTGGTWNWTWSGNSTHHIYIGVDLAWYSGSSWGRPILLGNNPLNAVSGGGAGVSSCAYTGGGANLFSASPANYYHFDNFEMWGMCWGLGTTTVGSYIYTNGNNLTYTQGQPNPNPRWIERDYIHGWSHVTFNGSGNPSASYGAAINGAGGQPINGAYYGVIMQFNVIDGFDSDSYSLSWSGQSGDCYIVQYNVVRYNGGDNSPPPCHLFHDNLFEYGFNADDGATHTDWPMQMYNAEANSLPGDGTPNLFYNNVVRHMAVASPCLSSVLWQFPPSGFVDYDFNNAFYDYQGTTGCSNYNNVDQGSGRGNLVVFNNTEENSGAPNPGGSCIYCNGNSGTSTITSVNQHWITTGTTTSAVFQAPSLVTETSSLYQTIGQANTQGYTLAGGFVPTSSSGGTVTTSGTNETTGYCADSVLHNAAAEAACKQSIAGVSYNSTTHTAVYPAYAPISRPSTGAWQLGAFVYGSSTQASAPSCSPGSGNYLSAQSVTCTNPNSGTTIMCYSTSTTPVTNGLGTGCTTGTAYTAPLSVSVAETLNVVAGTSTLTDSTPSTYAYTFNPSVIYGGSTVAGRATAAAFTSPSITVSGVNPVLVVSIGLNSSTATVSSVSFSASGTGVQAISARSTDDLSAIWCIAAPTAGAGTVTANFSASVPYQYAVSLYNGANQTTPCPSANAVSSTASQLSTTVTPTGLTSNDAAAAACTLTVSGDPTGVTPNQLSLDATTPINLATGYSLGTGGVTCTYDSTAGNHSITAVRIASMASSPPAASLSPTSLTFASTTVGAPSASQAITLSNTGGTSLSVASVAITGNYTQSNNCLPTVAASGSCSINVVFTPGSAGTLTGTLTVTDNSGGIGGSTQTASLAGTGASCSATFTSGAIGSPLFGGLRSDPCPILLGNIPNLWTTFSSDNGATGAGKCTTNAFGQVICRATDSTTATVAGLPQMTNPSGGDSDERWMCGAYSAGLCTQDSGFMWGGLSQGITYVSLFNAANATSGTATSPFTQLKSGGSPYTIPSKAVAASQVTANLVYVLGSTSNCSTTGPCAIQSYNFASCVSSPTSCSPTVTTIYDFAASGNALYCSGVFNNSWNSVFRVSSDDSMFSFGLSMSGGQGTAELEVSYKVGSGYRIANVGTTTICGIAAGTIVGSYGPTGSYTMTGCTLTSPYTCSGGPDEFNIHDSQTFHSNNLIVLSSDNCLAGTCTGTTPPNGNYDEPYVWDQPTLAFLSLGGGQTGGLSGEATYGYNADIHGASPHPQMGFVPVFSGSAFAPYRDSFSVLSTAFLNGFNPNASPLTPHETWQIDNPEDTMPILGATTSYGASLTTANNMANNGCVIPSGGWSGTPNCGFTNPFSGPGVNELLVWQTSTVPGSTSAANTCAVTNGTTITGQNGAPPCSSSSLGRIGPTYNSTVSPYFDAQNTTIDWSQTGRYYSIVSDWMDTLGTYPTGQTPVPGGLAWVASHDYNPNDVITPSSNNSLNCSFTSSGGVSGSTQPTTWVTSGACSATVTESSGSGVVWTRIGSIGEQNMRYDVFVGATGPSGLSVNTSGPVLIKGNAVIK